MPRPDTNAEDAETLGLRALVWVLVEPPRAMRLLELTGLAPSDLRQRANDPVVLAAALQFLEAHEADLVACAEALDVPPPSLVVARQVLEEAIGGDAA